MIRPHVHVLPVMRGNVRDTCVSTFGIVHAALIGGFLVVGNESSWVFGEVWPAIQPPSAAKRELICEPLDLRRVLVQRVKLRNFDQEFLGDLLGLDHILRTPLRRIVRVDKVGRCPRFLRPASQRRSSPSASRLSSATADRATSAHDAYASATCTCAPPLPAKAALSMAGQRKAHTSGSSVSPNPVPSILRAHAGPATMGCGWS
jgi:hypothetical protein